MLQEMCVSVRVDYSGGFWIGVDVDLVSYHDVMMM